MTASAQPSLADDRAAHMRNFLAQHGWGEASLHPLPGDASFRRYVRVRLRGNSAMLTDAPPAHENVEPYVKIARFLHESGYSAPAIHGAEETLGFVLAEDLGDALFTRALVSENVEPHALYDAALSLLTAWHGDRALHKPTGKVQLPDYNFDAYMREVALFADWFMPAALGEQTAAQLREEYLALWSDILQSAALPCTHFTHRDFHADNLLWLPAREGTQRVGLLDFQDALWGHPAYDLVSLLEDARRDVAPALAERCLQRYLQETGEVQEPFLQAYALLGAQRNSKIIGIFVRLSRRDGKHNYLSHLPRVWRYLERDLQHPLLAPLKTWLHNHIPDAQRGVLLPNE